MSQAVQQKIAEARQALDSANANLASNQSQTQQLQAAVTTAQQRVDELTQLDAAVDAEVQANQPAGDFNYKAGVSDPNAIDPVSGQPVEQTQPQ